jgi:hypothetical protein
MRASQIVALVATIAIFPTSTLAVIHRVQCFAEEDCQGDAGTVREIDTESNENDAICINTEGRKSCTWEDGWDNNIRGRFLGCSVCNIDLENGSEFACDSTSGCTSGGGCVNLMHPNGDYFEFTQVNEAGSTPCIQG